MGLTRAVRGETKDVLHDWLLLENAFKNVFGIGGPVFLDDKGFRYYLPAYMTLLVRNYKDCPDAGIP